MTSCLKSVSCTQIWMKNVIKLALFFKAFPVIARYADRFIAKLGENLEDSTDIKQYDRIFLHLLHIAVGLSLSNQRISHFTGFLDLTVWMLWPVHLSALTQIP